MGDRGTAPTTRTGGIVPIPVGEPAVFPFPRPGGFSVEEARLTDWENPPVNPDPPLRPWVVALILSAIGCDAEGPPPRVHATIEVTSADPTNPHEVDFGEVDFGDSREEELTITNVGPDTLQIHDRGSMHPLKNGR